MSLDKLTGRAIAFIVIGILIAVLLAVRTCSQIKDERAKADLATSQSGAATASTVDAIGTLGNRADAETATDVTTKENSDAIRQAEGADAPVAAPVHDAGLASLCRRAAYHSDPKCVRFLNP